MMGPEWWILALRAISYVNAYQRSTAGKGKAPGRCGHLVSVPAGVGRFNVVSREAYCGDCQKMTTLVGAPVSR